MSEEKWLTLGYTIGILYMSVVLLALLCWYQKKELKQLRTANAEQTVYLLAVQKEKLRNGLSAQDQPENKSPE